MGKDKNSNQENRFPSSADSDGVDYKILLSMRNSFEGHPKHIERVMEHYCWLCLNRMPIPWELQRFIGLAFWEYLGGGDKKRKGKTLENAFKLNKGKVGRESLPYGAPCAIRMDLHASNYYHGILYEKFTSSKSLEINTFKRELDKKTKKMKDVSNEETISMSALRDRIKKYGKSGFKEMVFESARNGERLDDEVIDRLCNNALYKQIFHDELDYMKNFRQYEEEIIKQVEKGPPPHPSID